MNKEQQFELAKEWYNDSNTTSDEKKFLESKFPQLNTESYYENMQKATLALARYCKRDGLSSSNGVYIDEIISWIQLAPKVTLSKLKINMIKEAYVSFEVAKLLKENGMDEKNFTYYIQKNNDDGTSEAVTTCTQQIATRWLRETYGIYFVLFHTDRSGWWYNISDMTDSYVYYSSEKMKLSYEEVVEIAIKYCLENLI